MDGVQQGVPKLTGPGSAEDTGPVGGTVVAVRDLPLGLLHHSSVSVLVLYPDWGEEGPGGLGGLASAGYVLLHSTGSYGALEWTRTCSDRALCPCGTCISVGAGRPVGQEVSTRERPRRL